MRSANQIHLETRCSSVQPFGLYRFASIFPLLGCLVSWSIIQYSSFETNSYLFSTLSFIWAMITAFVTRMMLHLRRVASSGSQGDQTMLFGETTFSTRIIWARHTSAVNSSNTAFSPNPRLTDDPENVDWRSGETEAVRGGGMEMQSYRADRIPADDNG